MIRWGRGGVPGFALVAILVVGCVTSGEGDKMRQDIARLRERVDAMDRRDVDINEQVSRLRKVLDQATALLQRNSADIGSKVDQHGTQLAALDGQIEEAKHALDELQKRVNDQNNRVAALEQTQNKIIDRVAPAIPEDKESLWREAQTRLASGRRDEARRFLAAFVQRFPQDARAAQAQLLVGQSFAAENKHLEAVGAYVKVIDTFPKAPEVPEAMWLMAQSYAETKACSESLAVLEDLEKRYPRSPRVKDARVRVRELRKSLRDKRVCAS